MTFSVTLQKREAGNAVALRAEGNVPCVVYGAGMEPVSAVIGYNTFASLYEEAGESTLIDIAIVGGDTFKALIQDVQYDPVKGRISHVDFRQIDMTKEMTAAVELTFVGESSAVKELGGTLMKGPSYVNIKCLPNDLISEITIDLSVLKSFEDVIHVSDLQIPAGVQITDHLDTVVAKVSPPLTEEQLKAMEEAGPADIADVKVEEKGKKEEAGAEGDAKAASEKTDKK